MTSRRKLLTFLVLGMSLIALGCKEKSNGSGKVVTPEKIEAKVLRENTTVNTTCGPNGCTTQENVRTPSTTSENYPEVKDTSFSVTYSCGPDGCTKTVRNSDGTVIVTPPSRKTKSMASLEYAMNFSFESSEGSDIREITGQNLISETSETGTDVQYKIGEENFSLHIDNEGKTSISGKLLTNNTSIVIDSKTQKCKITRSDSPDNHYYELLAFDCSDKKLKIKGEVLVLRYMGPGITSSPRR